MRIEHIFFKKSIDFCAQKVYNVSTVKIKHNQKGLDFMKKITTIEELIAEIENSRLNYLGLRGASEHDFEVEERGYLDCSLDLFDKRDCDYDVDAEKLPGTSAIGITEYMSSEKLMKCYKKAKGYSVNHHMTNTVYLIGDNNMDYGEDEDEVILGNNYGADIIAIVEIA